LVTVFAETLVRLAAADDAPEWRVVASAGVLYGAFFLLAFNAAAVVFTRGTFELNLAIVASMPISKVRRLRRRVCKTITRLPEMLEEVRAVKAQAEVVMISAKKKLRSRRLVTKQESSDIQSFLGTAERTPGVGAFNGELRIPELRARFEDYKSDPSVKTARATREADFPVTVRMVAHTRLRHLEVQDLQTSAVELLADLRLGQLSDTEAEFAEKLLKEASDPSLFPWTPHPKIRIES
jgi:hypothetical protein